MWLEKVEMPHLMSGTRMDIGKDSYKRTNTPSLEKLDLRHLQKISEGGSETPRNIRMKLYKLYGIRYEDRVILTQTANSKRAKKTVIQLLTVETGASQERS